MKKLLLTSLVVLLWVGVNAQIDGSLKLGMSGYQGDVHCRTDESIGVLQQLNASFGIGARTALSETVGLRVEGSYFKLTGDEAIFGDAGHAKRGWAFDNSFIEVAAMVDWELMGKKRFGNNGAFKRTLTPVIFGGIGFMTNNPNATFNNATSANISEDIANGSKVQLAVPVGLGLKYYLTERFALGLEAGLRLPVSDYYDGISLSANEENNDAYGFGGLKGYFRLGGATDTDGDGVVDKLDQCPEIAGLEALMGCPDKDADGVADKDDACPSIAGIASMNGCPDSDGDGIIDTKDACPNTAGLANMDGCPDADGDGIKDSLDKCPTVKGSTAMNGCPDSDGDGIIDIEDACPNTAGVASEKGCPVIDTDNDGVADAQDACPTVKGLAATNGCPDSDRDGVADSADKCPSTPGSVGNNGCPEVVIKEEVKKQLAFAARNVRFETSSNAFKQESYGVMNEIVQIMKDYPSYNVSIAGYTDSRGNDFSNQQLSESRAKACYQYLISKGISASRLTYAGYGETNPIDTNNTPEGRYQNRRVEFTLAQ